MFSQPNFDLAWCYFIIENDYLQISNSISSKPVSGSANNYLATSNTSDYDSQVVEKTKNINRRFSKTI
jgi:hypothetical protein